MFGPERLSAQDLSGRLTANPELAFQRGVEGQTLLHQAVKNGCLEIVDMLVREYPILLDLQDKKGNTPLHLLGETLWLDDGKDGLLAFSLGKTLLSSGADLNRRNSCGDTALLSLFSRANEQRGWLQLLRLMFKFGACPNDRDRDGSTYLHRLAKEGDVWAPVGLYRCLIDAGADPSLRNKKGFTAAELLRERQSEETEFASEAVLSLLE